MIDRVPARSRFVKRIDRDALFWIAAFLLTGLWTAHRLGAFDLWAAIGNAQGIPVRAARAYGTVDHPFHAVRAEQLLRSLRDGQPLRWVAEHQGGYPAEFYPFGAAALDVVGWVLTFGLLPMALVHTFVVIFVFLAPAIGFLVIARRLGISAGAAFVAFAAQIAVRGEWWSGGSQELVEWGMVTNVAAATELLIALPFLAEFALTGRRRDAGIGAALASLALYTNPRSLIALVAIGCAVLCTAIIADRAPRALRRFGWRIALAGIVTALLSAPELVSLLRFNNLYYFVRYSWYADLGAYFHSSVAAVSSPLFVVGLLGIVAALIWPRHPIIRAVALTLVFYVLATAYFVLGAWPSSMAEQLETTRLMPFQRLLWLALAGYGAYAIVEWAGRKSAPWLREATLTLAGAALLVAYVAAPLGVIPVEDRGLVEVPTAAQPGIVDLESAVKAADASAPAGTAMLILGTTLSWHDQLWAPLWTDRPLFFNDWLWYWQDRNFGQYNPRIEHSYPDPTTALTDEYFAHHGIGAVVVTGAARAAAGGSSRLNSVRRGIYDVYTVKNPVAIVTFGAMNADAISIQNELIAALGVSDGSAVVIRRNWFPRWKATVNGRAVPVTQTADGYMQVDAPAGPAAITLRYIVDGWDWFARACCLLGIALIVLLLVPERWARAGCG